MSESKPATFFFFLMRKPSKNIRDPPAMGENKKIKGFDKIGNEKENFIQ